MKTTQTGMEIGERMKLKEGISVEVAQEISERKNIREYFRILASLSVKETKERTTRETIYNLVKEGFTVEDLKGISMKVAFKINENKEGVKVFGQEFEHVPYRIQQEYMKVKMLIPEAFELDKTLALRWIEEGANHKEVIARFETMMEDTEAERKYFEELTLNEIKFEEFEDSKKNINKVHSEIDWL